MNPNEGVMTVEEARTISEGPHKGTIKDVSIESRKDAQSGEIYRYVDLHIVLDDVKDITLKTGFPAKVTEKTGLGQLISRFGVKQSVGAQVDVISALKGKKISCVTKDETNERGTFARIVNSSINPIA